MNSSLYIHRKEYLLYGVLLCIALLYPFLHEGKDFFNGETFQWSYILQSWKEILPFIVLLSVHIFVLMPYLFSRKQKSKYVFSLIVLLGAFMAYTNFAHQNKEPKHRIPSPPHLESPVHHNPPPDAPPPIHLDEDIRPVNIPNPIGPIIIDMLIAILLLGCSLAVRLLFKHDEDMRKLEKLEKEHMRQELLQLKAQISPHFLMNCLNNIHGMVEIDPQKSQELILELSGMMRYVLYESSSPMIALSREIDFLCNYISLMRVRYTPDKVAIEADFPSKEETASVYIPPLIFLIFIENAFKHGVNYQEHSFIDLKISIDENRLTLYCANSLHPNTGNHEMGGLGLDNIRKRLDILYADEYSLESCESSNKFITILTIPLKYEDQMYRG
ncbi:MAG: histidine kinase [Bacteroidaceae bacterium]|nr:histidine kinase [Bacteroidaceae bacterium]